MPLSSHLFRESKRLNSCLIKDADHIVLGDQGDYVMLVQRALVWLGSKQIAGREYTDGVYGPTTAAAVLQFKTSRRIINYAYQTKPDNIVGKMTIAALDREICRFEHRMMHIGNLPGVS